MPPKRAASAATKRKQDQPTNNKTKAEPTTVKEVAAPVKTGGRKRKAADSVEEKSGATAAAPAAAPRVTKKQKEAHAILNYAPKQLLDVYVFGTNCYGELGLGDATKKSEIPGPVLNPKLSADAAGVVQLAIGGVHSAALTHDNKILTWGVNDEGTLGRDTKEERKEVDAPNGDAKEDESDSDSDDDEVDLNMKEATPTAVDSDLFPKGTVFTQLTATDSATFALTQEGQVYGWGTFRGSNGVIGFSPDTKIQTKPVLVPGLEKITYLAAGSQHVLALTAKGAVLTWGCEEQNQLGRRISGRLHGKLEGLIPGQCALPSDVVSIGTGSYHSFAIRKNGRVHAWGSNNFGQTAVPMSAGESDAVVLYPTEVKSFRKHSKIVSIVGGKDHSLAVTEDGKCLTWGRVDNKALGIPLEEMPADEIVHDEHDRPRILTMPTPLVDIKEEIVFATASSDHSFAITKDGKAYSWGFNVQRQAGHRDQDEVERPTLLSNKHVNDKKLVGAAAGGQFSMIVGENSPQVNGNHA
ncbi:Ran exchange factor Prp20/Pim1 [Aspergillus heteromorphus CBS 117.55]|uniref:Ran exchange factor Prp20/Pim1 n=1 Tax=Aspergillus heteromorphus CBS 117.55 TaxID=1448321 RepID=A0A317X643_9EURO|nr:Ran exchange factor Prp20/Pim1 [Aspergillus heteromorphus CBS 117.55]PWY92378.1 Ran exchange factor Prp20/Pim1 [Aspergillus heteromorphus CBS 117.55]